MSQRNYVIALDQGTTSSRAIVFDKQGRPCGSAHHPITQYYPCPGWVEHDPNEIASTQFGAMIEALVKSGVSPDEIDSIGIANQRETTVCWDKRTGVPLCNAIVWQCRRSAEYIAHLCQDEAIAERIRSKTGLIPDAYFSASKIRWILDHVEGAHELAQKDELACGTIDSWLVWRLTNGALHVTDYTNASRTMLFNIHTGQWDDELLDLFDIPKSVLPTVLPSFADYGTVALPGLPAGLPICGVAGDQQAALFGQCCFTSGRAKNTYGTGCFFLMHTGSTPVRSQHGLVTTLAVAAPGQGPLQYALEGSVFAAGATIQWLRDELRLITSAAESEELALSVSDSAGVYVVPAFTGLGAPYWDAHARAAILGLTRGASRAHIVRAALESLAYQVADIAHTMQQDAGITIEQLNVDGGASVNNFLMQFQADILHAQINRPIQLESTALGAAFLAGLYTGFWDSTESLRMLRAQDIHFLPSMPKELRDASLNGWHDAVTRVLSSR